MTDRDMTVLDLDELRTVAADQPYRLLFATVSGAHLYGFPSRDSDVDLRGVHLLPATEVVGLRRGPETCDHTWSEDGAEIDLVTHDVAKFFRLLLHRNGYVLEQLLSPLVVVTGDAHEELVSLAPGCITVHHAHHYRGFAKTQLRLFAKSGELKPLLYTFRVLLTGVHLMRTGEVQAHLPDLLADEAAPSYLVDLMTVKTAGEDSHLTHVPDAPDRDTIDVDVTRLFGALEQAQASSDLPDAPSTHDALHDLLVRIRLSTY